MRNSKMSSALTIYLHVLLLFGCAFHQPVSSTEASRPVITDIRAQLFYGSTGGFSRNVLKGTDFALWNVVIGEGSAKGWSNETLVIVEVSSESDAIHLGHALKFKATYQFGEVDPKGNPHLRDIIVEGRRNIESFSATGKKYFGFWLNNTGCIPVRIRASISPINSVTEVEIPFQCGE